MSTFVCTACGRELPQTHKKKDSTRCLGCADKEITKEERIRIARMQGIPIGFPEED